MDIYESFLGLVVLATHQRNSRMESGRRCVSFVRYPPLCIPVGWDVSEPSVLPAVLCKVRDE